MSTVIVKADLATAKQYTGKSLSVKIGKKKFSAVLRVNVDDFNIAEAIELAKRDVNILMLNYVGSHEGIQDVNTCGVYVAWGIDVGSDVTEDDIQRLYDDVPDGVTLIVKLPEGYKNIRFLYDMSQKFDRIRFCGGSLFCFEDCKFGCCGRDVCNERGISYDDTEYIKEGCSCAIPAFEMDEVEFIATNSMTKTEKTAKKSKPKSNKTAMFSSLLYSGGKVEL